MKEYKIRITGKYDVIVLSPGIIARLIEKIREGVKFSVSMGKILL